MQYQKFEVGQPYKPGKKNYSEGAKFDFLQSGAVLELYFKNPTGDEIEDVTAGRFEIGFYERGSVIYMLFRFGGWQWMDAPYTVHLSTPFIFEEPKPGTGYGLSIFLIDAATGLLKGMRYVALSTEFSRKFKNAAERQKSMTFDKSLYDYEIKQTYDTFDTQSLVKRADVFCRIK